jgi:hypothetical protein
VTNKIDKLAELKAMLDQGLITQDEFDQLKFEMLATPAMGSTGRPFSVPSQPISDNVMFRNPHTGYTVQVRKRAAFWLTFLFGPFYLAYKEAWLHAGINLIASILVSIVFGLPILVMLIYPFFAYRIIVDSYRRKGWIESELPPPLPPTTNINPANFR